MATGHLLDTFRASLDLRPLALGRSRPGSVGLAHLGVMDTTHTTRDALEPVFTIAELATEQTSTCRLSLRKIGCTSHRTIQHDAGSVHTARSASRRFIP